MYFIDSQGGSNNYYILQAEWDEINKKFVLLDTLRAPDSPNLWKGFDYVKIADVDKYGYGWVEAFIDAMKEGGNRKQIIYRMNRLHVAVSGEGMVQNVVEATFYYKVLQRLCFRLGVLFFEKKDVGFNKNESQVVPKLMEKIQ